MVWFVVKISKLGNNIIGNKETIPKGKASFVQRVTSKTIRDINIEMVEY